MRGNLKYYIGLGILVIFHAVGLFLFLTDPSAADLAWLNIFLCLVVLLWNEQGINKIWWGFAVIYLGGYIVELIGVHTGFLFGIYAYDTALGIKLYEIPIIIGANWLAIVISATAVARKIPVPFWPKVIIGAILGVGMDYLIEPVAIRYNFWHWMTPDIPVFNYVCWFIFLFLFIAVYLKKQSNQNTLGIPLFIIWTLFFTILNFT